MISIESYACQFQERKEQLGKPLLLKFSMPAIYKPVCAYVHYRSSEDPMCVVIARVQDDHLPKQERRILLCRVGDVLPDVLKTQYDSRDAQSATLQWSFWQATQIPGSGGYDPMWHFFDVTHLKLKGYDDVG